MSGQKRMKILVLTTKPPWPPRDGGAVASKCIIEGLAQHGADISVISMITRKHEAVTREPARENLPVSDFKSCYIDTTVKPHALVSNLVFSSYPYDLERFYSADFMQLIKSLTDIEKYDIIHCEGLVFALYAGEIRKLTNAPLILRAHNIEHHIREMMSINEKFIPVRLYLKNLSRRIKRLEENCRNIFDAIVTITEDDKKWFDLQKGEAPVFVSGTGVTPATNKDIRKTEKYRVGFIGALDWQPNISGLVWFLKEVWPSIIKYVPEASLTIAGRNASKSTAGALRGTNVIFEGEIDNALSFTSSMCVMIAPLFAGSGMRIKIIEAMSAGVPVVASPVAAKGIPVTNKKDILLADSKELFSSAVIKLLTNNSEHDRIATEASGLIMEKYDNTKITSKLLEFYKVLTNDR